MNERPGTAQRRNPRTPGERARLPEHAARPRWRRRPPARSRAPTPPRPPAGGPPAPSRPPPSGARPSNRHPAGGPGIEGREQGSATVLAVGVVAALVLFAGAFAAMGQASAARHRAQGAADAAALAGAARVLLGDEEACEAAAAMTAEGGADLERCEVKDLEVTVAVAVEPAGVPALFGPARAVARAGPVMTH